MWLVAAEDDSAPHVSKRQRLQEIRERLDQALKTGQRIAIDLSMEHLMSEKVEIKMYHSVKKSSLSHKQFFPASFHGWFGEFPL